MLCCASFMASSCLPRQLCKVDLRKKISASSSCSSRSRAIASVCIVLSFPGTSSRRWWSSQEVLVRPGRLHTLTQAVHSALCKGPRAWSSARLELKATVHGTAWPCSPLPPRTHSGGTVPPCNFPAFWSFPLPYVPLFMLASIALVFA